MQANKTVDDYLNDVSYDFTGYIPSEASLNFINFIKLVNGEEGEENESPVVHYQLLDNVFSAEPKLAILAHRGFSKSSLLTEYLTLYIAVTGQLDGFGEVTYTIFIGDSVENGCKNLRKNMENRYNGSEFLLHYLPTIKFTDSLIEFTNIAGDRSGLRLVGAQQSLRGTRYLNTRPKLIIADDIISDADSRSPTCIAAVENTIHKAAAKALHPKKNKFIYIGTVYNQNDPLYKVIESGRWSPSVFPVCEKFPCTKEEFKGSWEDRFPYSVVKDMYDDAVSLGRLGDFNGEMMNRVMSEEDRVILDSDITWYKRSIVISNRGRYNFYITTDLATSDTQSSDFSVISVWAYTNNGEWLWVDGVVKRQLMDKNIDDIFRLVQLYSPQSVGIEISGQQKGFIAWIQSQMLDRNVFFSLASDSSGKIPGIRPKMNKVQRFATAIPLFKMGKIWFPTEKKASPELIEAMQELSMITVGSFKSKHDDFIDTISMLTEMSPWKPSEEATDNNGNLIDMWGEEEDEEGERIDSYIV